MYIGFEVLIQSHWQFDVHVFHRIEHGDHLFAIMIDQLNSFVNNRRDSSVNLKKYGDIASLLMAKKFEI